MHRPRRKTEIRKKVKSFAGPNEHYGNVNAEDMSSEEFQERKEDFLRKNFHKTAEELEDIQEVIVTILIPT